MSSKWYVVWEGTERGICETWEECKARVLNYPNAKYKAFSCLEDAIKALRDGNKDMGILRAIANAPKRSINYEAIPEIRKGSVAVDAACSGNPGVMEYQGVEVFTGASFFKQGPFPQGTNNIGEFLAIVHALALLKKSGDKTTCIYSDSRTAIAWVRDKTCKTKLKENATNAKLFAIVRRAETWLRSNTYVNPILKWNTKEWGEIPADFGRK